MKALFYRFLCAAGLLAGLPAAAQLNLPAPNIPPVTLPGGGLGGIAQPLGSAIGNTVDNVDTPVQTGLRAARIRELLRANRATLESDPNGAPMLRSQLVALSPSADSLARIATEGFSVLEERALPELGMDLVVLSAPNGWSTARALRRLRALDPSGSYDYNHLYLESGDVVPNIATAPARPKYSGAAKPRVGLIDGGVEKEHAVFRNAQIETWGCAGQAHPSTHGTAVASLLVGDAENFHGAAAGGTLYAADVYCGNAAGGALNSIAQAFAWLVQQPAPVINISLVGPPNVLLEQLVRALLSRGHLLVAAVGNDGPASKPLYPAAYPGVIGVTAVDAKDRVLLEAVRGKQVAFAAPGADMAAATLSNAFVAVRGTSFAAPIVAGLLATEMQASDTHAAETALDHLSAKATDLGSRGVDKIYGKGLLGESLRVPLDIVSPASAHAAAKTSLQD